MVGMKHALIARIATPMLYACLHRSAETAFSSAMVLIIISAAPALLLYPYH
jgi:hypothetical protein